METTILRRKKNGGVAIDLESIDVCSQPTTVQNEWVQRDAFSAYTQTLLSPMRLHRAVDG